MQLEPEDKKKEDGTERKAIDKEESNGLSHIYKPDREVASAKKNTVSRLTRLFTPVNAIPSLVVTWGTIVYIAWDLKDIARIESALNLAVVLLGA